MQTINITTDRNGTFTARANGYGAEITHLDIEAAIRNSMTRRFARGGCTVLNRTGKSGDAAVYAYTVARADGAVVASGTAWVR